MKQLPGEDYEVWIKRAQQFEYGRSLQRLANGDDPVKVLEDLAHRLTQKMVHPILKVINQLPTLDYNEEESLQHYKDNYINKVPKAADHISNEDNGHVHNKN